MPKDGITYMTEVKICLSVLLCMGLHTTSVFVLRGKAVLQDVWAFKNAFLF